LSAFDADGKPIANTWQGIFSVLNTNDDGHVGTAPVGCFRPNGYGLRHDRQRVGVDERLVSSGPSARGGFQPTGPDMLSVRLAPGQAASRVIKGGSVLCAADYCARYRPAARQPQETNLSAEHLGFRTVLNAQSKADP
jgi:sulfatase modifying factor 1